jgi:MFS family permease
MVIAAGTAIALCIMGDSLMYSVLPLHAAHLGWALPLVGILLSANRIVRLISNQWAGSAFERYGPRIPFVGSAALGLTTTFAYGLSAGFLVFLLARIAWGIAWSGLRQGGYVATWTGTQNIRGRLTGLLLGLIRFGSAAGVVLGGVIYDHFGFVVAVETLAVIGLLAIPVALSIPWHRWTSNADATEPTPPGTVTRTGWQQSLELAFGRPELRWLSITSFFTYMLGGVIVSTTSIYILSKTTQATDALVFGVGVATITGLLHGARWSTNLLIGPLVGAMSDRIGKSNTLLILILCMFLSLITAWTAQATGAIVAFLVVLLLDGSLVVVVSATANTVATETPYPHKFIAAFATLTDAGSALGPLIAYSALATTQLPIVYVSGAAILTICIAKFWQTERTRTGDLLRTS